MVNYIEVYDFAGRKYGIEDFDEPGAHFFTNTQKHRFKCWVSGCGICEGHDTIEQARAHIREYAVGRLTGEIIRLQSRISLCQDVVVTLEDNPMSHYKLELVSPKGE